MINYAM
jgi:hypothetical protein